MTDFEKLQWLIENHEDVVFAWSGKKASNRPLLFWKNGAVRIEWLGTYNSIDHAYKVATDRLENPKYTRTDKDLTKGAVVISSFSGEYRFLSNFYPAKVFLDGEEYLSVEHAYQAAKAPIHDRKPFQEMISCGEAKRRGQKVGCRTDWEHVKDAFMEVLVKQKFFDHKELGDKLLATGDSHLVEGNTWGDTYWGVCNGAGQNKLGAILLKVRDELKQERKKY